MFRGTTPTLKFNLPFDVSLIDTVWVTFSQNNKEIFTIETADCVLEETSVTTKLTQKQTLMLKEGTYVEVQVRVLTDYGDALVSCVMKTFVNKILKDGEII